MGAPGDVTGSRHTESRRLRPSDKKNKNKKKKNKKKRENSIPMARGAAGQGGTKGDRPRAEARALLTTRETQPGRKLRGLCQCIGQSVVHIRCMFTLHTNAIDTRVYIVHTLYLSTHINVPLC